MFKKLKAFTITETITVLTVIGVIAAITVGNTLKNGVVSEKKMKALSKTFYMETEYAYQLILTQESNRFSVVNLKKLPRDFDPKTDTPILKDYFFDYMDLSDEVCTKFPVTNDTKNIIYKQNGTLRTDGLECAVSSRNILIAFRLDRVCDDGPYQLKEYLQDDNNLRAVEDVCGFVAYAPIKTTGTMGRDFFVIPLDKRRLK
ncbi:MAG: type II secretion system protein [Cyanobacteria bacterium SIG27]|nr:type II secretion system protein [Cyanobacteria bacterium SIG27]